MLIFTAQLFSGTIIAHVFTMETKLTQLNSILDLPIKSIADSQRSSSTFSPINKAFPVNTKQKLFSSNSSVKEQNSGFEKALKKKKGFDDNVPCKENESDESKEAKYKGQKVYLLSEQAVNITIAEPAEQVAVQVSTRDTADLLNEDTKASVQSSQPQNTTITTDNNIAPETQLIPDTQISSQPIEQGTSDIENQQTTPIAESTNGQLPQNNQLSNKNEALQNKPSDLIDETNQQDTTISTKVEDSLIKNTSETNSPLLSESLKSHEEPQIAITDNNSYKTDQIKSPKDNQDSSPQNNTRQNQSALPNPFNDNAHLTIESTKSLSASYNNAVEIDIKSKADNPQQNISIVTDIPTNIHHSESNKDISQTQNIETLSQSVAKQMQNSINLALNRNQDQITISLNPPELGKVTIKFIENQNQISGVLQVAKSQIRAEIESALPQIIRNLEASGINVKRIDVEVFNQSNINQQPFKDHNPQGNFSSHQDSAHNQNNPNHTANTSPESKKARILSGKNTGDYQQNSALDSESINLFA